MLFEKGLVFYKVSARLRLVASEFIGLLCLFLFRFCWYEVYCLKSMSMLSHFAVVVLFPVAYLTCPSVLCNTITSRLGSGTSFPVSVSSDNAVKSMSTQKSYLCVKIFI